MHDTAYRIGGLAMQTYCDLANAAILEIGAQNVNGTLRDFALPTTRYIGLDIEEAKGVDLVMEPGKPLPVEDDAFDLVMATSVFEHDPAFWMTFVEMCRKTRPGGYVYFNAPSNGAFHQYPQDHWRFYPDCGKALVEWARSQGQEVELVETFLAEREKGDWNDFVGVFRKRGKERPLPSRVISDEVPSTNVRTWRSDEIIRHRVRPEDMELIRKWRGETQRLEKEMGGMQQQLREKSDEVDRLVAHGGDLEQTAATARRELEVASDRLVQLESALVQRQEEMAQTYAELAGQKQLLQERSDEVSRLAAHRRDLEQVAVTAQRELEEARGRLAQLESTLAQRQEELAQTYAELAGQKEACHALKDQLSESERRHEETVRKRVDADAWVFRLAGERSDLEKRLIRQQRQLDNAEAKCRQSEIACHRAIAALEQSRLEKAEAEHRLANELDAERARLNTRFEEIASLSRMLRDKEDEVSAALERSRMEKEAADRRIAELENACGVRAGEIAAMSRLLEEKDDAARMSEEQAAWLREVAAVLLNGSRSRSLKGRLAALLPTPIRVKKQKAKLKRKGIFDAGAYLAAHPDVAERGMDPLQHYIIHGMHEGRQSF